MGQLLNSFLICFICCLQGITSQQIELYLKNCQVTYINGEKLELEAFVNTTGTNETDWPVDNLTLYNSREKVLCTVNITKDNCSKQNTTECGYCDRQEETGYVLYLTMFTITYNESFTIRWYGKVNYVQNYLYFEFRTFGGQSVLTRYWPMDFDIWLSVTPRRPYLDIGIWPLIYLRTSSYNTVSFFGTRNRKFVYHSNDSSYEPPLTSIHEDLILLTQKPTCQFVCPSIGSLGILDLVSTLQIQGDNFSLQLQSISLDDFYIYKRLLDGAGIPRELYVIENGTLDVNLTLLNMTTFFTHNLDLSLYFKMSKCNATTIWSSTKTNVTITSDCPSGSGVKHGLINRNSTATCRCQITEQSFLYPSVQWFDTSGQPVSDAGHFSDLVLNNSKVSVTNSSYICYETVYQTKEQGLIFQPKFFDIPSVVNFSVNGSDSLHVKVGDDVTFYCEVQGDPTARAVLLGSGLGRVKENISESQILELSFHDLQCEDSGRYFCTGRNGFEDNMTSYPDFVDVNIPCPIQNVQKDQTVPTIHISADQNTVFTFKVYGYPEPKEYNLKIETGKSLSDVDSKKYSVIYIRLIPPFGQINITVYDSNERGTITYVLNVKNVAGEVIFKFQAIKQLAEEISGIMIEPIIGGSVGGGGFLLVCVVVLTICLVKRKRQRSTTNTNARMSNYISETRQQINRPFCTDDLTLGYVDPQTTRDYLDPQTTRDYLDPQTTQDYVDPKKTQDYLDPQTDFTYQFHASQNGLLTIEEPATDYPND